MYPYSKQVLVERLKEEIAKSTITAALDRIDAIGVSVQIYFKATLTGAEEATLNTLVAAHVPTPIAAPAQLVKIDSIKTSAGVTKVAIYEPEGDSATVVSHNFADPCSWYQASILKTDEVLTHVSGQTQFTSAGNFWIDLESGRIYDEDNIMMQNAYKYRPVVKVDGVVVTTGYTINYPTGTVVFAAALAPAAIVSATFYQADKSYYILKPKPGKIVGIKAAEVQFGADTILNGPLMFEAWFNHPQAGMVPIPGSQIIYKNFKDFISACNEGQGMIPKIGDVISDVHVFPFHYARPKAIKASQGVEIRVYCKTHQPCGGTFATASFYITVENEAAAV